MERECTSCNLILPMDEFHKQKEKKDGVRSHCKVCRKTNPRGLKREAYYIMLEAQGNCCKICNTDTVNVAGGLVIDHCHTSNKVRGLLCRQCNRVLGLMKDNVQNILRAAEYLDPSGSGGALPPLPGPTNFSGE